MDICAIVKDFYKTAQAEKRVIGKSTLGRDIYALKTGSGSPVGIAQYAIHGREYITALLSIEQFSIGVQTGTLWVIPLANPDGAALSCVGLSSVRGAKTRERLLRWNNGNADFSLWKANARGVDLNVNFDAEWGKGTHNITTAGAENYIGKTPFSESETRALKRFTERIRPDYTVSYHTKGEEIYWYFHQPMRAWLRDKSLANRLSKSTGYPLAYARGSAGGYKDWCIRALGIPAFTIEAGLDSLAHPITESGLLDIIRKNARAIYDLSGAWKER